MLAIRGTGPAQTFNATVDAVRLNTLTWTNSAGSNAVTNELFAAGILPEDTMVNSADFSRITATIDGAAVSDPAWRLDTRTGGREAELNLGGTTVNTSASTNIVLSGQITFSISTTINTEVVYPADRCVWVQTGTEGNYSIVGASFYDGGGGAPTAIEDARLGYIEIYTGNFVPTTN